jgi:branched-chain amino acid aminotransferase
MNFLYIENGKLKSPPVGETVLPGITRDTLFHLSADLRIQTSEGPVDVDALCRGIEDKQVSEALACGTGSSIQEISELGWKGKRLKMPAKDSKNVTSRLQQALFDAYFGRKSNHSDWIVYTS